MVKITSSTNKMIIIIGLIILMAIALIIDGQMGERVMGVLMTSFGFIVGYFFRKTGENSS